MLREKKRRSLLLLLFSWRLYWLKRARPITQADHPPCVQVCTHLHTRSDLISSRPHMNRRTEQNGYCRSRVARRWWLGQRGEYELDVTFPGFCDRAVLFASVYGRSRAPGHSRNSNAETRRQRRRWDSAKYFAVQPVELFQEIKALSFACHLLY